jgi:uncharacterized protein
MTLVDANILLFSVDEDSPFHPPARDWMTEALNGPRRVGIPWQSLWAFLRISTNPRAAINPLSPAEAWRFVTDWLAAPATWVPQPGRGHARILEELLLRYDLRGGLVSDAALAALCLEHGLTMISADTDFARFTEVTWVNPLAGTGGPAA